MFAKTFRNTLIASTLVVAGSVLANPAMAADVLLGGSVDDVSSVTVESGAAATAAAALELSGMGTIQTDQVVKVADLTLFTNNAGGVTLTATGTGETVAQLVNTDNPTTPVDYVVFIADDEATGVVASNFTGATKTDTDSVTDFVAGDSARDLYIMYSTPALLDPGTYEGSITVTVTPL